VPDRPIETDLRKLASPRLPGRSWATLDIGQGIAHEPTHEGERACR
jgi:hypothetical protein